MLIFASKLKFNRNEDEKGFCLSCQALYINVTQHSPYLLE